MEGALEGDGVIDAESLHTLQTNDELQVILPPMAIEAGSTQVMDLLSNSTSEQIPSNILHRMRPEEDNIERQNGRMVATDTEKIIVEQYNRMDSLQQPAAFTNRHDVEGQDAALNASSPEWSPMSSPQQIPLSVIGMNNKRSNRIAINCETIRIMLDSMETLYRVPK